MEIEQLLAQVFVVTCCIAIVTLYFAPFTGQEGYLIAMVFLVFCLFVGLAVSKIFDKEPLLTYIYM